MALSACAQLKVTDQLWYSDVGVEGAVEFHTAAGAPRNLTKAEWDALREGMVCTDPINYAADKALIKKLQVP